MPLIFTTDYIDVFFNKTESVLEVLWKIPPTEKEFNTAVTFIYDSYLNLNFSGFLVDAREAGILSERVQEWASKEWLKRKNPSIPHFTAVITSHDYLEQLTLTDTLETIVKTDTASTYKYFDNELDARLWLSEQISTVLNP